MNEYLLLFRNASAETGYLATTQDMAEDMPKWQAWIGEMAMQGRLVNTAPIHYEGSLVDRNGNVIVGPYKTAESVLVSGYVLCKAVSVGEVHEWAKRCPILKYPNSSVEIRGCVPFPSDR